MLEFRLLGSVDLRRPPDEVLQSVLVQPKRVALLAYLAIARPRGYHRRDTLLALFWPELDGEHARGSLRNSLYRLRQYAGEEIVVGRGSEEVALSPDVWCDVVAFENAVAEGRHRDALELYRGDLMAGFFATEASAEFDQWLDGERARLRPRAAASAWQLSQQTRDRAEAVAWARAAVEFAPTEETGIRRLITLLRDNADRAGALEVYEKLVQRLARSYGVDPDPETQALIKSIRTREARLSTATPRARDDDAVSAAIAAPLQARRPLRTHAAAVLGLTLVLTTAAFAIWRTRVAVADATGASSATSAHLTRILACCESPSPRSHASAVIDSKRNSLIVFGGRFMNQASNEVWSLQGAGNPEAHVTWTQWRPRGLAPAPRWGHAAAYDSITDRMMVFGGALGFATPCSNDVWLLKNASGRSGERRWEKLTPSGRAPAPRAEHSAVYDAHTRRLIVFGGHDCMAPRFNDVWVLENANGIGEPRWRPLAITGARPAARSAHSAVWDAGEDRLVVVGGHDADGHYVGGVWQLAIPSDASNAARWSHVTTNDSVPARRAHHASAFNPVTRKLIISGGSAHDRLVADAWLLEGKRWRRLEATSQPLTRAAAASAYDEQRSRLLFFGGDGFGSVFHDAWMIRF